MRPETRKRIRENMPKPPKGNILSGALVRIHFDCTGDVETLGEAVARILRRERDE